MSKLRASAASVRKCVFCRYWRGRSAVPIKIINYWEYESDDRGDCLKRRGVKYSYTPGCPDYELDTYKYPLV